MDKTIEFHLEDFTGPLDLLLALIAKNKMSIYDIEILTLIDQYLEVVGMPETNALQAEGAMDSASEFVGMAARLVQMKSTLLLPKSDEAERMREELTGLLVEYSACKKVAAQLKEMALDVHIVVRAPMEMELDTAYHGTHNVKELEKAYFALVGRATMRRAPRQEQFDELVTAPFVSVAGMIIHVLRGLITGKVHKLRELFGYNASRSETVATFLALLELIRSGRIYIDEEEELCIKKGYSRYANAQTKEAKHGP